MSNARLVQLDREVSEQLSDGWLRLGDQVLEEITRLVEGRPFENEVTEDALRKMG